MAHLYYVRDRMRGAPRSAEAGAVDAAEGCLSSGSSETFETAFSLPRLRQQLSPLIPRMWTWMVRRSCSASVNRSEMTLVKTLAQTAPPVPTLKRRGDDTASFHTPALGKGEQVPVNDADSNPRSRLRRSITPTAVCGKIGWRFLSAFAAICRGTVAALRLRVRIHLRNDRVR